MEICRGKDTVKKRGIKLKGKRELARYLLDAKKNVDSMWYIVENAEQLKYLNLRKKTNDIRREFYIDCCIVIDELISSKKLNKKELCAQDGIIERVYYERDKNSAHKDERYREHDYSSLLDIKKEMENQVKHVREAAAECLPDNLTLDFVCHDREMFRFVHHVTADIEEEILKKKYPLRNMFQGVESGPILKVLNDTEDLRKIEADHKSEYGVIMSDGLCFNEGVQERQDACVRINALYGENMWCSVNEKEMKKLQDLTELGAFDEFGIIQEPPKDPILNARIQRILDSPLEKV